jgi:hypothetical protein
VLSHLSAAVRDGFVAGYAESIQTVFLIAVPIAALAFVATWFIPQLELKRWTAGQDAAAPAATPEAAPAAAVTAEPDAGVESAAAVEPAAPIESATHEALDPVDTGLSEH